MQKLVEGFLNFIFPPVSLISGISRRRRFDSSMQLGGGLGAVLAPAAAFLGMYSAGLLGSFSAPFLALGPTSGILTLYCAAVACSMLGRFLGFLGGYLHTVFTLGAANRSDLQALKAAAAFAAFGNGARAHFYRPFSYFSAWPLYTEAFEMELVHLDNAELLRPSIRKDSVRKIWDHINLDNLAHGMGVGIERLASSNGIKRLLNNDPLASAILDRVALTPLITIKNLTDLMYALDENCPGYLTERNIITVMDRYRELHLQHIYLSKEQIPILARYGLLAEDTQRKLEIIARGETSSLNEEALRKIVDTCRELNLFDQTYNNSFYESKVSYQSYQSGIIENRRYTPEMCDAIQILEKYQILNADRFTWILQNAAKSKDVARTLEILLDLDENLGTPAQQFDRLCQGEYKKYDCVSKSFQLAEQEGLLTDKESNALNLEDEKGSLGVKRKKLLLQQARNLICIGEKSSNPILASQEKFDLFLQKGNEFSAVSMARLLENLDEKLLTAPNCKKIMANSLHHALGIGEGFSWVNRISIGQQQHINLLLQPEYGQNFDLIVDSGMYAAGVGELLAELYKINPARVIDFHDFIKQPEFQNDVIKHAHDIAILLRAYPWLINSFEGEKTFSRILNNPSKADNLKKSIGILEKANLMEIESNNSREQNLNKLLPCIGSIDDIAKDLQEKESCLSQMHFDTILKSYYKKTLKAADWDIPDVWEIFVDYAIQTDIWSQPIHKELLKVLTTLQCDGLLEDPKLKKKLAELPGSTLAYLHIQLLQLQKSLVFTSSKEKNQEIFIHLVENSDHIAGMTQVIREFNKRQLLSDAQAQTRFNLILENAAHTEDILEVFEILNMEGLPTDLFEATVAHGKHANKIRELIHMGAIMKIQYYRSYYYDGIYTGPYLFCFNTEHGIKNLKRIIHNAEYADKINEAIQLIAPYELFKNSNVPSAQKYFELLCDHAPSITIIMEKINLWLKGNYKITQDKFDEIIQLAQEEEQAKTLKNTLKDLMPEPILDIMKEYTIDAKLISSVGRNSSSPIYSGDNAEPKRSNVHIPEVSAQTGLF